MGPGGYLIPLSMAFAEGVLSFFSPCTLPLVGAYAAVLANGSGPSSRGLIGPTVLFIAGATLVLAILGFGLIRIGAHLAAYRDHVTALAAAVMFFFGLQLLSPVKLFQRELRPFMGWAGGKKGAGRAFLLGAAFACGWTPCIGPMMGSALAMALADHSRGMMFVMAYALGLGLPFVVLAAAFDRGKKAAFLRAGRFGRLFEAAAGAILLFLSLRMIGILSV